MKILVTGFEPFGGSLVNPSQQVIQKLPAALPGIEIIITETLPVDQDAGPKKLLNVLAKTEPDVVLCLGEAARRAVISIERVAINLLDFKIPDNSGHMTSDRPVIPDGPVAYFVTLPVRNMLQGIQSAAVPAELSLSAGSYLCNQVLYTVLDHIARNGLKIRAGFIHLPVLPEEALFSNSFMPSMSLETSLKGILAAIQVIGSDK